jgi:hypothetical protein
MRLPAPLLGVIVLVVFLGTVATAVAAGAWTTSGRTTGGGERVELATDAAPAEVKGWMAVGDVADAFGVPFTELLAAFDLPADTPPSTPLKDLESETFSVSLLREWLAVRPD